MRDLLLSAIVFGALPLILYRPHIGALMWVWIGMMNPHLLTFGFAARIPFAQLVALTTLVGFAFTRRKQAFPLNTITALLVSFFLWMCVTRIFALNTDDVVNEMWGRVFKIQLMLWVTLMLISGRRQIDQLIWTIAVSIGYYGVKGGVFTALTGGAHRVWGPQGSFIGGNNELALALVVLIPLLYYLWSTNTQRWLRHGLLFAICTCALAALGSHSRGALLAITAMVAFLIVKSGRQVTLLLLAPLVGAILLFVMPESWWARMETIETYQEDASAMARLHTWRMVWTLALDRPIVGAGFDLSNPLLYHLYAENKEVTAHAAHSIYFQALGEHGFVGLALYLCLGYTSWRWAAKLARKTGNAETDCWVPQLMRMVQTSMIGFAVGGAFLGLLHFDLPYYLIGLIVLARREMHATTAGGAAPAAEPPATGLTHHGDPLK